MASRLDWNDCLQPAFAPALASSSPPDLVIAADCIYHQIPAAFTATALHFMEKPWRPQLVLVSPNDWRPGIALVMMRPRPRPASMLQSHTASFRACAAMPAVHCTAPWVRRREKHAPALSPPAAPLGRELDACKGAPCALALWFSWMR